MDDCDFVVERDIAYGPHPAQRLDVHRTAGAADGAPLLVLIHGGAWQIGDKAGPRVVQHKRAHWVAAGWVLVSINYRLLPEAAPCEQADDVARALAHVQANAARWGADPARCVPMAHSSGAHLLALLLADTARAARHRLMPFPAAVLLDGAAYDVEALMAAPHPPWLDTAFGADPAAWRRASPQACLAAKLPSPTLLVCSALRPAACAQARAFAARAQALGSEVELLPLPLAHGQINAELGLPGAYTDTVDRFVQRARN